MAGLVSYFAVVLGLCWALAVAAEAQNLDRAVAEALRTGRYAEALDRAGVLLKSSPREVTLLTAQGVALAGLNRPAEGLIGFDRALSLQPHYVPALRAAAETAYRARLPRGLDYLTRLIALQPDEAAAHAMLAVLRFEQGNCKAALPHFEKARAVVIPDPLAASLFSQCLLAADRAPMAVAVLEQTRRGSPGNRDTVYNLAVALNAANRSREAVRVLEFLAAADPPPAAALSLLGVLRAKSGDLAGALPLLDRAVASAPSDERPYLDYGIVCTDSRNWTKAVEVATAGLASVPRSARLRSLRGVALFQLGRLEEAVADFEAADALEPRRAFGAAGQGLTLSDSGRSDEALAPLRKALARQPADPQLQYLLADALLRSASEPAAPRIAEARRLLENSIAAQPGFFRAQALLGKLYRNSGRPKEAIALLRRAVELDPANRLALQQLALALRDSGRMEEAAEAASGLRRALAGGHGK